MRVRYHGKHWNPNDDTWSCKIGKEGVLKQIRIFETESSWGHHTGSAIVIFDCDGSLMTPFLDNLEPADKEAEILFVKIKLGVYSDAKGTIEL